MSQPTRAQLAMTEEGRCTRCGAHSHYRNTAGECMPCHNLGVIERRAARKAQIAAMPRCEVDGCNRRGAWRTVGGLLLCGPHLERAKGKLAGFGIFGMAFDMSRASVLALIEGR